MLNWRLNERLKDYFVKDVKGVNDVKGANGIKDLKAYFVNDVKGVNDVKDLKAYFLNDLAPVFDEQNDSSNRRSESVDLNVFYPKWDFFPGWRMFEDALEVDRGEGGSETASDYGWQPDNVVYVCRRRL